MSARRYSCLKEGKSENTIVGEGLSLVLCSGLRVVARQNRLVRVTRPTPNADKSLRVDVNSFHANEFKCLCFVSCLQECLLDV